MVPIIGIGHLTVGIGRLSTSADNQPIVLVSKTTENAFNCSSH